MGLTNTAKSLMAGSLLICFVLSKSLIAQQPLSLSEALSIAMSQNLKILQQTQNQRIAALDEDIRKAERLPTLDLSGLGIYLSQPVTIGVDLGTPAPVGNLLELNSITNLSLSVTQPVFTGLRLQSNVRLAENNQLSEQAKRQVLSDEIALRIHLLFYQAQHLEKQQGILELSIKRLQIQLDNVRNLYEAAQAMAFDTLQVYNQMLSKQIALENIRLSKRLLHLQMARILDLQSERPIETGELIQPTRLMLEVTTLQSQAMMKRPELESIRIARSNAMLYQKIARAGYYPNLSVFGTYNYGKPGLEPVRNQWMDFFTVGANLSWNLWKWGGDKKNIQKYQVLDRRLSLEERELIRSIEYELKESVENIRFNLRELALAEALQQQQAERYRIVVTQHSNGVATTSDLITAETDLTAAELQTQLATVKYYVSHAKMRKAIGTISEVQ
jgi:outer membrane protein TolC